jgi:MFS family permease
VRIGERTSAIAGAIFVFSSMVTFALLTPSSSLLPVVIALVLAGLGMGVGLPSTSSTMANEVKPSEFGVMSAAQLLATQVGEVAGIQALLTIQESVSHGYGTHPSASVLLGSFRAAFWVGAAVSLIGVLCTLFIRRLPRATPPGVRAQAAQ